MRYCRVICALQIGAWLELAEECAYYSAVVRGVSGVLHSAKSLEDG